MEIVPILSAIILVGTVATFILAVAAYVLYKVREKRAKSSAASAPASDNALPKPVEPHVLVAPAPQGMQALPYGMPGMGAPALGGPAMAAPMAPSQPAPAAMYIPPTSNMPPQGPVIEVEEELPMAADTAGMWNIPQGGMPAYGDRMQPNRPSMPMQQPSPGPRIAPPQFEPMAPQRRPGPAESASNPSMFYEYTNQGFIPVNQQPPIGGRPDPRGGEAPGAPPQQEEDDFAWL